MQRALKLCQLVNPIDMHSLLILLNTITHCSVLNKSLFLQHELLKGWKVVLSTRCSSFWKFLFKGRFDYWIYMVSESYQLLIDHLLLMKKIVWQVLLVYSAENGSVVAGPTDFQHFLGIQGPPVNGLSDTFCEFDSFMTLNILAWDVGVLI